MALNNYSTACGAGIVNGMRTEMEVGGGANAILQLWTAGFGTKLADIDLQSPCASATATKTLTFSTPMTEASAITNGTAAVCRWVNKAGSTVVEGTVSATGGGGDVELSNTTIAATDQIDITSGTWTAP